MTTEGFCPVRFPPFVGGGICGRPLSDRCKFCLVFDRDKEKWAALFNEYRSPPRVAVEGDI